MFSNFIYQQIITAYVNIKLNLIKYFGPYIKINVVVLFFDYSKDKEITRIGSCCTHKDTKTQGWTALFIIIARTTKKKNIAKVIIEN